MGLKQTARTWAEIDFRALRENYHLLRGPLNCKYMAVVKANAYGHGAEEVSRFLEAEGADWFAVAVASEGILLRKAGVTKPILIFGYTDPSAAADIARYHLTQSLISPEYTAALEQEAAMAGVTVECHTALDTGMGRIGFNPDAPDFPEVLKQNLGSHLRITGTFTHFSVADDLSDENKEYTQEQYRKFLRGCEKLEQAGIPLGLRHCCNSAAAMLHPEMQLDMVRGGIAEYGFFPSSDLNGCMPIRPVLSWYSHVSMVKRFEAGMSIGYGRMYTTREPKMVAVVPVGYADGYFRALSNCGWMMIHGKRAKILGRVCMDQTMVDVTDIPEAKMGDVVTLAGDGVTFDDLARICNTIHYEFLCAISPRVPRVYLK